MEGRSQNQSVSKVIKKGTNSTGSSKMGIRGMSRSYPDSLTKGILSRGRSREKGTGHILHRLAGNRETGTGGSRWETAPLSLRFKENLQWRREQTGVSKRQRERNEL